MTEKDRWIRNTADFTFRAVGVIVLLVIAEAFVDFNWTVVGIGVLVWWVLFCSLRTPKS